MSYPTNSILRLFNSDNIKKATAIITTNGEIMQLKPVRQLFKTLGEWHTDEDDYMKVEKIGFNNDFLMFKKYNPESSLTYTPSEMEVFNKKKKQLYYMNENPSNYLMFHSHRLSFFNHIQYSSFKTIRDADEFLQGYIKKGLGMRVNSHIYDTFRSTVDLLGLTSGTPIVILDAKVRGLIRKNMLESSYYINLKKTVDEMNTRKLSSTGTYTPRVLNRIRLYYWQNRTMTPIYVNYQKKVFTLGTDSTTYKTLKSAGIDASNLFYLDPLSNCIMPI